MPWSSWTTASPARSSVKLVMRDARQPQARPHVQGCFDLLRREVELVRLLVVEARADVGPPVRKRRRDVLLGGDDDVGLGRDQVEQVAKAVERQDVGDV